MKRVRCIDNDLAPILIVGRVYEVLDEDESAYYIAMMGSPNGVPWMQSRFEEVDPSEITDTVFVKKDYGAECPCGLVPAQCDYHK